MVRARTQVASGPFGQPPAARGDLDRDLDQQRGGAAGEVGARPAVRQFGQVREVGQLRRATTRIASAGLVPGIEPIPVALPKLARDSPARSWSSGTCRA